MALLIPLAPYVILFGLSGALAVVLIYTSQRTFPVGVVNGFQQMSQVWLLILSYFFFQERIGVFAALAVMVVLAGVVVLAMQRSNMAHLKQANPISYIYVFLFPFFMGLGFFLVAFVGKQSSFLAAGYAWEVSIGIIALIVFFVRKFLIKSPTSKSERPFRIKDAFWIAVFSSATLLGTGGSMILYGIASPGVSQTAISSIQMISMCLLSMLLYREHLRLGQWLAIFVIIIGLGMLKIVA